MAHPAYLVDQAFRQFLYYWQCGLEPSLYLNTNADGTVFICSKVNTITQACSDMNRWKPRRRSGRGSRRRRTKKRAHTTGQPSSSEIDIEPSEEEFILEDDYSEGEPAEQQALETLKPLPPDLQTSQPNFSNVDSCTASDDLIVLDTVSPISSDYQEADQVKSSYSPHHMPTSPLVPLDSSQAITYQDDNVQDGYMAQIPIEVAMLELMKHINARW